LDQATQARYLSWDVPLKSSQHDQKIYIEVLANTAQDRKPGEAHEVAIAFDPACEQKLRALALGS